MIALSLCRLAALSLAITVSSLEEPRRREQVVLLLHDRQPIASRFAEAFNVGFGLARWVNLLTDPGDALVLARWLYIDDETLFIGCANDPPICQSRIGKAEHESAYQYKPVYMKGAVQLPTALYWLLCHRWPYSISRPDLGRVSSSLLHLHGSKATVPLRFHLREEQRADEKGNAASGPREADGSDETARVPTKKGLAMDGHGLKRN